MIRVSAVAAALIAVFAVGPTSAIAQARKPTPSPAGQGQALELGTFGEWTAYASQAGRNKVCYVLTKPKERLPKTLTRDPGFLFITSRPAEQVRNEVSFVLGFAAKESTPGEAVIGTTSFALAPKGKNAWIANAAEENSFIEAARRGQSMNVRVTSGRGNATTDRYSLAGLTQALERIRRECP